MIVDLYVCGICNAPLVVVDGRAQCTANPEHGGFIRKTTAAIRRVGATIQAPQVAASLGLRPEPHWIRNQDEFKASCKYVRAYLCAECGAELTRGFVDGVQAVVCQRNPEHRGYRWHAEDALAKAADREEASLARQVVRTYYPELEVEMPGDSLALLDECSPGGRRD